MTEKSNKMLSLEWVTRQLNCLKMKAIIQQMKSKGCMVGIILKHIYMNLSLLQDPIVTLNTILKTLTQSSATAKKSNMIWSY